MERSVLFKTKSCVEKELHYFTFFRISPVSSLRKDSQSLTRTSLFSYAALLWLKYRKEIWPHVDMQLEKGGLGTSLVVQWLRLCTSIARGTGSIPGRGTKIPQAV